MKRNADCTSLSRLLEGFLVQHLRYDQDKSSRTIESYSTCFRLLLEFFRVEQGKDIAQLQLSDWSAPTILDFLRHCEKKRGNGAQTRNQRLGAIKSFFKYVGAKEPAAMAQSLQVRSISTKRFDERLIGYLSHDEMDAVLKAVDRPDWHSQRDLAMFTAAYQTAARVSEFTGMDRADAHLKEKEGTIHIHGKGRKDRVVVLTAEATRLLRAWEARLAPDVTVLFPNRGGQRMTRSGASGRLARAVALAATECPSLKGRRITPHIIRHTTAMHLLENGKTLYEISLLMGHERVQTTHKYLRASIAMKRKTLESLPMLGPIRRRSKAKQEDLFSFLESLQRNGRPPLSPHQTVSPRALLKPSKHLEERPQ